MTERTRRPSSLLLCGIAAAMLFGVSGCATVITTLQSATEQEKSKILHTSYGAADILAQQSGEFITPSDVISVEPLLPLNAKNNQAAFGHVVVQNVAARLVQLGYKVGIPGQIPQTPYTPPAQPYPVVDAYGNVTSVVPVQPYQQPQIATYAAGQGIILTGHYAETRTGMLVSLRLVNKTQNRVLGAYDYSIPMQSQVKDLLRTDQDPKDQTIFDLLH